jgi:hypothetical protein
MSKDRVKFTIFGERCSGTNWLEYLLVNNFELETTWDASFKHWFGYKDHEKNILDHRDIIYFGIVRNPIDYLVSFYKRKHNQPTERLCDIKTFLLSEFYSIHTNKDSTNYYEEILEDRKYDGSRYKNIFEMRAEKCKFLLEKMPSLVPNYMFIKYEDLKKEPENILNIILKKFDLVKKNKQFYIEKKYVYKKHILEKEVFEFLNCKCEENYKVNSDLKKIILENLNKEVESRMGYIL